MRLSLGHLLFACLLGLIVFAGWRVLWFITDDAYIFFRYASNCLAGRGLVWNPEPFLPVEGYTSFLWLLILTAVWAVFGIEPPDSANTLGLLFGFGTLFFACRILRQIRLPDPVAKHRRALSALVLLAVATDRQFLTWLSSGLETSLFVFCITWWVSEAIVPPRRWTRASVVSLTAAAALLALTRPDGILMFAATIVLLCHERLGSRSPLSWGRALVCSTPLLVVPAHLAWRRLYYGDWLPNTYYAKHVGPWPESGIRYFLCFAIEYGVWLWLAVAALWILLQARSGVALWRETLRHRLGVLLVVVALLGHFSYFTFIVGGDHFEYRVYGHLAFLLGLSFLWMCAWLTRSMGVTIAALGLFVCASHTVSWAQWVKGWPIAPAAPTALRRVFAAYDEWQLWLGLRYVCLRWNAHKSFAEGRLANLPTRAEGLQISWEDRPVYVLGSVGVTAWVLPNIAIIDRLGLNDWVVARTSFRTGAEQRVSDFREKWSLLLDTDADGLITRDELTRGLLALNPVNAHNSEMLEQAIENVYRAMDADSDGLITPQEIRVGLVDVERSVLQKPVLRMMAHDRHPPPGYISGFAPNVKLEGRRIVVSPREKPLTDDQIRRHEAAFRSGLAARAAK